MQYHPCAMKVLKPPLLTVGSDVVDQATLALSVTQDCQALASVLMQQLLERHVREQPLLIQIAGSVAVGKTTLAQELLKVFEILQPSWQYSVLSTDHFLLDNQSLIESCGLDRKGFPESYHQGLLTEFLEAFKNKKTMLPSIPIYSHAHYDHLHNQWHQMQRPDVLILEGVIALNPCCMPWIGLGVFIDAPQVLVESWYLERFMLLRAEAQRDDLSYFKKFCTLSDSDAREQGLSIWRTVNAINWFEHISPTRRFAACTVLKSEEHAWDAVHVPKHWAIRTAT